MRDKRFIAVHRGGPLKKEQHRQLILWSCKCVEHVLPLVGSHPDKRVLHALEISKAWAKGKVTVGDARKAAVQAIAAANSARSPVAVAVARAAGHAVATAHMADHALGGALYALKAIKLSDQSVEKERKWQNKRLPAEISELILSTREAKEKSFKLL